jgi:DNA mismatch endonuclease, patch repair protein
MQATHRRDTRPEQRVRSLLHRSGLRYRVDYPIQTSVRKRRPDIVFTRQRLAIFIDGCFWHLCPTHCRIPTRNQDYWVAKLEGNAARDRAVDRELEALGWVVLRFWEHQPTDEIAALVKEALQPAPIC